MFHCNTALSLQDSHLITTHLWRFSITVQQFHCYTAAALLWFRHLAVAEPWHNYSNLIRLLSLRKESEAYEITTLSVCVSVCVFHTNNLWMNKYIFMILLGRGEGGGYTIESDHDAITSNPVAWTIPKWRKLKLPRLMENMHNVEPLRVKFGNNYNHTISWDSWIHTYKTMGPVGPIV
jgi:hypothetical protein